MRTYLENVTAAELADRKIKLEAMIAETRALLAAGIRGEARGSHIVKGSWVTTYANEAGLNSQEGALKDTLREISNRQLVGVK